MRRQFLMRTAVLGSLFALVACDDRDTTVSNAPNERVTTAPGAPTAEPGNGKALMFQVPPEASVLLLARP
jgi:hypothetical protein